MMNKKTNRIILLFLLAKLLTPTNLFAQKNKKNISKKETMAIVSTGLQDREFWYNTLYRIAYPVVHNLANETLKKNMPVEQSHDYFMDAKSFTYLEAVGRTFARIAPWLKLPDDNSKEGMLRKQLRTEALQGLVNAVNPSSPDYLN